MTDRATDDPRKGTLMPELAAELWNRPLLIDARRLDAIRAAAVKPEALLFFFDEDSGQEPDRDGIRHIPIKGTIFPFRLDMIRRRMDQAIADPNVRGILLDVDSPGGSVTGTFDLASHIFASRGKKPIWAVANDDAFSAAYALASAAERVHVTQTGGVGSVGVIAVHVEFSKHDEDLGIKFTTIFSGARKNDYSDTEPLNDAARALLQAEVDRLRGIFVEAVAKHRGMDTKAVRDTEAGIFFGPGGTGSGFADAVANLDETHDQLRTEISRRGLHSPAAIAATTQERATMAMPKTIETAIASLPESFRAGTTQKITAALAALEPIFGIAGKDADETMKAAIETARVSIAQPYVDVAGAEAKASPPPDPAADPTLPETVRAEIATLRQKSVASEEKLARMERENRRRDLDATVRALTHLPGERAAIVTLLEKADDGGFRAELETFLGATNEHAKSSKLLTELGGTSRETSSDAWNQIQAKATALRASNPKLTQEQAITQAMDENPKLYAQHMREQSAQ